MRFQHPGVKLLDFSPKENYLVTVSPQFQANDNPKDPQVWAKTHHPANELH